MKAQLFPPALSRRSTLPGVWCLLSLALASCAPRPMPPEPPHSSVPSTAPAASASGDAGYRLPAIAGWTHQDRGRYGAWSSPDGAVELFVVESDVTDLPLATHRALELTGAGAGVSERRSVRGAANDRFLERLLTTLSDARDQVSVQAVAFLPLRGQRSYVFVARGGTTEFQRHDAALSNLITGAELAGAEPLRLDPTQLRRFDAQREELFFDFAERARAQSGIPGLAIAVVTRDGSVVRGLGSRGRGAGAVDADTRFLIGSITKSFSSLLAAALVDEGKLSWQAKAHELLPAFRLSDPTRTEQARVEHLFCACIGVPRRDLELFFGVLQRGPSDIFRQLAALPVTTALGETYQYNNQVVAAGGYLAAHVALPDERDLARAYARALQSRVLSKLSMERTSVGIASAAADPNRAAPHLLDWSGAAEPIDVAQERFVDAVAPSGALWSTANDMARYLQMQLARGVGPAGIRIVSERNLGVTQTPGVKLRSDASYGLGWELSALYGLERTAHLGSTLGFEALLAFYPQLGAGIFVAANRAASGLSASFERRFLEILFDLPARVPTALEHDIAELRHQLAESRAQLAADPVPPELLGSYVNDALGKVTLRKGPQGTLLDAGDWSASVGVFRRELRPDTLLVTSGFLQGKPLIVDRSGRAPTLMIELEKAQYVLRRL